MRPPMLRFRPKSSSSTTHPRIEPPSCWPHAAACASCAWNATPASQRPAMPAPRRRAARTCIFSTTTRSSPKGGKRPLLASFARRRTRRRRRIATARSGRTNLRSRRHRLERRTRMELRSRRLSARLALSQPARRGLRIGRQPHGRDRVVPARRRIRSRVPSRILRRRRPVLSTARGRRSHRLSAALGRRSCRRRDLRKQRARRRSRGTRTQPRDLRAALAGRAARAFRPGCAQRRDGVATPRQAHHARRRRARAVHRSRCRLSPHRLSRRAAARARLARDLRRARRQRIRAVRTDAAFGRHRRHHRFRCADADGDEAAERPARCGVAVATRTRGAPDGGAEAGVSHSDRLRHRRSALSPARARSIRARARYEVAHDATRARSHSLGKRTSP